MISPIRMTQFGMWKLGRALWRRRWKLFGFLVVPSLLLLGFSYFCVGSLVGSNKTEAKIQMGNIKQSLDMYYTRTDPHEYPKRLEQLVDKNIMKEVPSDPWGHPFVYVRTSDADYALFSAGPDGIAGTDDDIGRFRD